METIRLADVVDALSRALDITEGQPAGHARRACAIGMEIAGRIGLDPATRGELRYALLLKDAGCSTNAAQVAALYGHDDAAVKHDRKTVDHLDPRQSVAHLWRSTAPGRGPVTKARQLRALVAHGSAGSRELTRLRCERGADIARMIGFGDGVALAIRDLDEHWDGRGYPQGLAGEAIDLGARIALLAQTIEVHWAHSDPPQALAAVRARSGTWFDPQLVAACEGLERDGAFWTALGADDGGTSRTGDPGLPADDARLDRVAAAFAQIIDAKSPYTARHSDGVAWLAARLAVLLGHDRGTARTLYRAGLLHDIGKLGVSNRILDKQGPLDDAEWEAMRRHPALTLDILRRVPAFAAFAAPAAAHHERLDGTGYHLGLDGSRLGAGARILAVADVAEALSADRPYRAGLGTEEILGIVARDAGTALDAQVAAALPVALAEWLDSARDAHGAAPWTAAPADRTGAARLAA
jgi:HD-GYP domain-containing protein (c-di-GMP phosphodiesterase class II)